MRKQFLFAILLLSISFLSSAQNKFTIEGLNEPVEIIVDQWGIPHIYAKNEADLFFAQGYYAASDRLFQFEVWRRQATGTVAELLGERELKRDIGTRLFKFRGDIKKEMNHYHPHGELIITSFVKGVNAYIDWINQHPEQLPMEFKLLKTKPQQWTPEVVISRHQGLLGNIKHELTTARQVIAMGEKKTKAANWFHPHDPDLTIDTAINQQLLLQDILEIYKAYRQAVRFQPEDIIADARNDWDSFKNLAAAEIKDYESIEKEDPFSIGSNNWVVNGEHTESGFPMMANDPHRTQAVPSLRYMAHLVAPGWNVIGGGEPEIPGISIGHNEYGTWGLTVFRTDAEDLYVYKINPKNANQYWYKGKWEDMKIIEEMIPVKKQKHHVITLKYTRHGPVVFEDEKNHVAYAVRCGWAEIGGSPYLASLRMNQSKNFEEFREACSYSHIPGENMVWADKAGNIGWQAVGIAPIRHNWSGLVPVPGDGRYEWDGYLPIKEKPHNYNPKNGIFSTANQNVTYRNYKHTDALGFSWADPYRGMRVEEVLHNGRKHNLMDMAALQTDYYSVPARILTPLLKDLESNNEKTNKAIALLLDWDFVLDKNSITAGIYVAWERTLRSTMNKKMYSPAIINYAPMMQLKRVIDYLILPDGKFGKDAIKSRDDFLLAALDDAIKLLTKQLGDDWSKWQYGQKQYKHILLKHPMSSALNDELRKKFEVGPVARGGNKYTVGSTGGADNQPSGGSFRIIVDTGNWDHCIGTNNPGQSGDPDDPHYKNLFKLWANDKYFPIFFSKEKIESVEFERINLSPKK